MGILDFFKKKQEKKKWSYDWLETLKVGDVIYHGGDKLKPRVIRSLSKKNGKLTSVTFTIKRCSWTHRCTTTYNRHDLTYLGFTKSRKKIPLKTKLDKKIQKEIDDHRLRQLDCCDVKGIC